MLSKNQHKLISSLHQKKYRNQHQLFLAEGIKVVNELLQSSYELEKLFCTQDYFAQVENFNPLLITDTELSKISRLATPNKVVGLFRIPVEKKIIDKGLILVLDTINDPGNLGTIIRLADWFGVSQLVCSKETVDCYNAKVVQASMGSLTRLSILYTDLVTFLNATELPIYGANMNGENVYKSELKENAVLVMGNEANGISAAIEKLVTYTITIPRYSEQTMTESLNVATATAILLNEFRRK